MATRKTSKKSSKKRNSSLLTAGVIILAFLILIIIFLFKKDTIFTNFKETHFFDRIFGSTPEFVQNYESSKKEKQPLAETEPEPVVIEVTSKSENQPKEVQKPVEVQKIESEKKETVEVKKEEPKKTIEKPVQKPTEKKDEAKPAVQMAEYQLCFVVIDSDGSVTRKIIKRTVPKNESPLTYSINLLLKGPDKNSAAEKYCRSLIPSGTRLLSARVKDGTAYLNFSQEFEINPNGIDGYQAQLMQIVYTATAFSTVNSVQFMIEGEERPYLSEAIWIGSPLTKNSFN